MPSEQSVSQSANGSNTIELRAQMKLHTPAGETYQYLLRNSKWSSKRGKAMLNQAAQDYWLAYARQSTDPSLAKTTALACIERMEYQIAQLRNDFHLISSHLDLIPLLTDVLAEIRRGSQSLDTISTALTKGSAAILPTSTVLANDGISPDSAVSPALLTEPESATFELERSYTTQDLDDFCRENGSFLKNLAEDLG